MDEDALCICSLVLLLCVDIEAIKGENSLILLHLTVMSLSC